MSRRHCNLGNYPIQARFKIMGIAKADCTFLFYAKTLNVSFEKTLTLGRLRFYAEIEDISKCLAKYKNGAKRLDEVVFKDVYTEPFFEILGAKSIQSIDYSNYQGATLIHDLNTPLPVNMHNQFSCVIDSGTLEHIFNFPVAIRSCMEAVQVGGHFIGITPVNNQMGHGFYQFSPELYYRIFSEENGFKITRMLVTIPDMENNPWYEVADPAVVSSRVTVVNNQPLVLMFIAEKTSRKEIFLTPPQQSDYVTTWKNFNASKESSSSFSGSGMKNVYHKIVPDRIQLILRNIIGIFRKKEIVSDDLGIINPEYFKRVEI